VKVKEEVRSLSFFSFLCFILVLLQLDKELGQNILGWSTWAGKVQDMLMMLAMSLCFLACCSTAAAAATIAALL
jgi:hypothetical protein